MTILDIGGGFLGSKSDMELFKQAAMDIRDILDKEFGKDKYPLLDIRAEPGN